MDGMLGRLAARQHLLLALLVGWLVLTSPWVHMFRRIPRNAGFLDLAHVWLGLAALALAITFTIACTRRGRWRLHFPWLAGDLGQVARDLRGLLRREVPTAEGGGLFALIEGLLLLAVLATAFSGAGWLLVQGSAEAVSWRDYHILAARSMMVLLVLHILSVSLHLLDFIGEGRPRP
jgi:hypothetical protein